MTVALSKSERLFRTKLAKACDGHSFPDIANSCLDAAIFCIAKMASSPEDAFEGASLFASDLQNNVRQAWLEVHGQAGSGTG